MYQEIFGVRFFKLVNYTPLPLSRGESAFFIWNWLLKNLIFSIIQHLIALASQAGRINFPS